jgi:hypothetical protein
MDQADGRCVFSDGIFRPFFCLLEATKNERKMILVALTWL